MSKKLTPFPSYNQRWMLTLSIVLALSSGGNAYADGVATDHGSGISCNKPDSAATWTCQIPSENGLIATITGFSSNAANTAPDWDAVNAWVGSNASKTHAIAIGDTTTVSNGNNSIAIGAAQTEVNGEDAPLPAAIASGDRAIAIGTGANANDWNTLAIGAGAEAIGGGSLALGEQSKAQVEQSIAIGGESVASKKLGLAVGFGANSNANGGVAIGHEATVNEDGGNSVVIGYQNNSDAGAGVSLGWESHVYEGATQGIAIGRRATVSEGAVNGIAVGYNAIAGNERSIALGRNAYAGNGAIQIGYSTLHSNSSNGTGAYRRGSTLIGDETNAQGLYSTVVGNGNNLLINERLTTGGTTMFGHTVGEFAPQGAFSNIFGAYNTVGSRDRDTNTQLYNNIAVTVNGSANEVQDSNGVYVAGYGNTVTNSYDDQIDLSAISDASILNPTGNQDGIADVVKSSGTKMGQVGVIGAGNTLDNGNNALLMGMHSNVNDATMSSVQGFENTATGVEKSSIAGTNNTVTGASNTFLAGSDNTVTNTSSVLALGNNQTLGSAGSDDAAGTNVSNSVLLGDNISFGTTENGENAVAIGNDTAVVNNSVALGVAAQVTEAGGVALGNASVANRDAASGASPYVPGSATDEQTAAINATVATTGAVSVGGTDSEGNSQFRQITNVAAGSEDSDAVNVSQLKAVQVAAAAGDTHFYSVNNTDTDAGNYNNDGATGANALAAGVGATATGDRNIAIGNGATAGSVFDSIAIGNGADVQTRSGIAIGSGASVDAVRTDGNGEGYWGVALGNNANVYGEYAVAIGGGNVGSGAGGNMVNSAGVHGSALGYGAQAGYNGTALGYGAEAPGTQIVVPGRDPVELGYSTAVGYKAITGAAGYGTSIGGFSTASSIGSIAVGNNTNATGPGAIAIGGPNNGGSNAGNREGSQSTGSRSIAMGSESRATADDAIVIGGAGVANALGGVAVGGNANVSVENGVALGRNSVADRDAASGASPYVPDSATDDQTTAINATVATTGAVSVGVTDPDGTNQYRQITNVAAGSEDSDAVNVAQLKAVQVVADAASAGWDISAQGENATNVGSDSATGSSVDLNNADGNIVVSKTTDSNDVTFDLNKDIDLGSDGSLTIGDTVVNNAGVAVGDDVALGNTGLIINNGPSITTGGINAGNLTITNVAPGVNGTDAVNVDQLRAAGSVVEAGSNVASIDAATNADGGTTYTVNANGASVSGGSSALTVAETTDSTTNVTDYAIDLSQEMKDDIQKGRDAKDIVDNQGITFAGDTGNNVSRQLGDTLHINGGANAATALTDGNIGVVADGTDTLAIKLNKDIDLGSDGSLAIGNTIVNNGGVVVGSDVALGDTGLVINDGPSITTGGINAGNLAITNVAPGVNGTDAVNVNQLRAAGSVVEAGTNVASVDAATNADGGTTYTVNANGASVSGGSSALTVAETTDSTTNVTDYAIDLSQETKADIQKGIDAKDIVDNQGIAFAGDTGADVSRHLGDTLHINGGANEATALTDGNIGVVTDGTDTLAIKLNKDIDLGSDGSLTIGGTTINGNSINATNLTVNGETHLGNHFTVNNDGSVHYDGLITEGDNIVNKDYVDNSINNSGNNSPLTFTGDDSTQVSRKLGEELTLKGGADVADLTDDNIGIVANTDDDGLEIKLNKNINLSSSGSLTIGDTLINTSGLVINNGPSITNVGVDAGGMKITNVAPGLISADSTDAVNGSQLFALQEVINNYNGGEGGSWNIDTDNSHTPSESTPVSDTGSTEVNSGDTVTIVAGDNIDVSHDGRSVTVATVANPTFNNVTANAVNVGNTTVDNSGIHVISSGDSSRTVSLTGDGLDNGGNTITNVAAGVNGTDAVNVNQLNQVGGQINNAINQLNHNINEVDKRASSGIASAMATAGLPQAYMPGKSMVAAAGGTYRGRNAVAIGVSSISDSGKWVLKGTASVNEHDAGASVGVGYQW